MPMQPTSNQDVEVADLDRLFEEYVEMDLLHPFNNSASSQSSSDELAHLFELASSNERHLLGARPILDRETKGAWHKALRDCDDNMTSPWSDVSTPSSFAASSSGKESHSDSESSSFLTIVELDRDQLQSASQPSTPRPHTSGRTSKKAVSFHSQLQHGSIKRSSKKPSTKSSSKMMQSTHPRFYPSDFWSRKTETPIGCLARNSSASYPASSKPFQQEQDSGFPAQGYQQSRTCFPSLLAFQGEKDVSHHHSVPSVSPALGNFGGNNYNDNIHLEYSSCNASNAALPALPTPPSSNSLPAEQWCPDTAATLNFDLTASPDFIDTTKTSNWWNNAVPNTQSCYSGMENTPHFPSRNLDIQGLGITSATSSFDFGAVSAHVLASSASSSFDLPTYNTMYPTQRQHPLTQSFSHPSSPEPQLRAHRKRNSRSRRPSQRRKSSSSGSSSRQANSTTNNTSGDVGFVNFTPEDSRKILTGVAPSGSSKTKARREKEAADKRRKLSQLAMKAVLDAGGNLETIRSLERDGLLVV